MDRPKLFWIWNCKHFQRYDEAIAYFGQNSFPSEFFHTRETQTYIGSWSVSYKWVHIILHSYYVSSFIIIFVASSLSEAYVRLIIWTYASENENGTERIIKKNLDIIRINWLIYMWRATLLKKSWDNIIMWTHASESNIATKIIIRTAYILKKSGLFYINKLTSIHLKIM